MHYYLYDTTTQQIDCIELKPFQLGALLKGGKSYWLKEELPIYNTKKTSLTTSDKYLDYTKVYIGVYERAKWRIGIYSYQLN